MQTFELKYIEQIVEEIKELEKEREMSDEKKAYYLYHKIAEKYQYKEEYYIAVHLEYLGYEELKKLYDEGTIEYWRAICTDMNKAFVKGLELLGIYARLSNANTSAPVHSDVSFKTKDGKWYFADMSRDTMHVKTGMKVRSFGLSQEQLEELYKKEKRDTIHIYMMNYENDDSEFSGIEEKQLEEWDKEFGFTYKGLYTNDIINMLSCEMGDKEFLEEFFETKKKDEIVQKKLEFIMDKIQIINIHNKVDISHVEAAVEYYLKIASKIFTRQEESRYIEIYRGYVLENGKRTFRAIIVIKKDNENIYYSYRPEKQIFEETSKKELMSEKMQLQKIMLPKKKKIKEEAIVEDIGTVINRLEDSGR